MLEKRRGVAAGECYYFALAAACGSLAFDFVKADGAPEERARDVRRATKRCGRVAEGLPEQFGGEFNAAGVFAHGELENAADGGNGGYVDVADDVAVFAQHFDIALAVVFHDAGEGDEAEGVVSFACLAARDVADEFFYFAFALHGAIITQGKVIRLTTAFKSKDLSRV